MVVHSRERWTLHLTELAQPDSIPVFLESVDLGVVLVEVAGDALQAVSRLGEGWEAEAARCARDATSMNESTYSTVQLDHCQFEDVYFS